jgi:hypothetical protein
VGAAVLGATEFEVEELDDEELDESSPVDAEDPVDAVSDDTALGVAAEDALVLEELVDVLNANVSATRAARVAVPVAIRVRRVEFMAPVVPGELKTSVRVRLCGGEPAVRHSAASGPALPCPRMACEGGSDGGHEHPHPAELRQRRVRRSGLRGVLRRHQSGHG